MTKEAERTTCGVVENFEDASKDEAIFSSAADLASKLGKSTGTTQAAHPAISCGEVVFVLRAECAGT